jgi:hypothetical protein
MKEATFDSAESFTMGPLVQGRNEEDWAATVVFARVKLRWEDAIGVFLYVKNSTFWSASGGFQAAQDEIALARSQAAHEKLLSHNEQPYVVTFQKQVAQPAAQRVSTPPQVPVIPPAPKSSPDLAGPVAGTLAGVTVLGALHSA